MKKARKNMSLLLTMALLGTLLIMPQGILTAKADFSQPEATIDENFQFHYATDSIYSYLWVPEHATFLRGLVAIKANLSEMPLVYSKTLRDMCREENFGILFFIGKRGTDANDIISNFYLKTESPNPTINGKTYTPTMNGGRDAAYILEDMLKNLATISGFEELTYIPLVTIGHSAAAGFGIRSPNWNANRVITAIALKSGQGMGRYQDKTGLVEGVPILMYTAQYTEHTTYADRDRSVADTNWWINNIRSKSEKYLASTIIEWGAGHYDWTDAASVMLCKYIKKAIAARLGGSADTPLAPNYTLNDLSNTGYTMNPVDSTKPKGWVSELSVSDQKLGLWFFDQAWAEEVMAFTADRKPPTPGVAGGTYTDKEPHMVIQEKGYPIDTIVLKPVNDNTKCVYNGISTQSFLDPSKPDTFTLAAYYMNKIPDKYDGAGNPAPYPASSAAYPSREGNAIITPMMGPYEIVNFETSDAPANDLNVARVTKTTLRFKNNRVYYREPAQDSYVNITSYDVYDTDGTTLKYQFKAVPVKLDPFKMTSSTVSQTIQFNPIPNISKADFAANDIPLTVSSSQGLPVDVFVEYGPAKAIRTIEADGSYSWRLKMDQIPEGAKYPIEVNVVASQQGRVFGTTVNAAVPVERRFYIYKDQVPTTQIASEDITLTNGAAQVNGLDWRLKNFAGIEINATENGSITLSQASVPENAWTASFSAGTEVYIPFTAFTKNGVSGSLDYLDLMDTLTVAGGGTISSIKAVYKVQDVLNAGVRQWWSGKLNVVWKDSPDANVNAVEVKNLNTGETQTVAPGVNSAIFSNLTDGAEYSFLIRAKTPDSTAAGVTVSGTVNNSKLVIDDFETGDYSSYPKWTVTGATVSVNNVGGINGNYVSIATNAANQYIKVNLPTYVDGSLTKGPIGIFATGIKFKVKNSKKSTHPRQLVVTVTSNGADRTFEGGYYISDEWQEIYVPFDNNLWNGVIYKDLITAISFGITDPTDKTNNLCIDDIEVIQSDNEIGLLSAIPNGDKISLGWLAPANADRVKVYNDNTGDLLADVAASEQKAVITGLTQNTTYKLRLDSVKNGEVKSSQRVTRSTSIFDSDTVTRNLSISGFWGPTANTGGPADSQTYFTYTRSGAGMIDIWVNGSYWAAAGATGIYLYAKTDPAVTLTVYLEEFYRRSQWTFGERWAATLNDYAINTLSDGWVEYMIPFSAFAQNGGNVNNGVLDVANIRHFEMGSIDSNTPTYTLYYAGLTAQAPVPPSPYGIKLKGALSVGRVDTTQTVDPTALSQAAKAFDGDITTWPDATFLHSTTVNAYSYYVQTDLGEGKAQRITRIRYYPRPGLGQRVSRGQFYGSLDGQTWTLLYVIRDDRPYDNTDAFVYWHTVYIRDANKYRYIRYYFPSNSYGNIAEIEYYTEKTPVIGFYNNVISMPTKSSYVPQTSDMIGTTTFPSTSGTGTKRDSGKDYLTIFDGDPYSFTDLSTCSGKYAQLNVGTPVAVKKIRYFPRADQLARAAGTKVQGSTDGTNFEDIAVFTQPASAQWTEIQVNGTKGYTSFRVVFPGGSYGNMGEVELVTYEPLEVIDNGATSTVLANVPLTNYSNETRTLQAMIAIYDKNGKLTKTVLGNALTLGAGECGVSFAKIEGAAKGQIAKLFVWDSINTMKPWQQVKTVEF